MLNVSASTRINRSVACNTANTETVPTATTETAPTATTETVPTATKATADVNQLAASIANATNYLLPVNTGMNVDFNQLAAAIVNATNARLPVNTGTKGDVNQLAATIVNATNTRLPANTGTNIDVNQIAAAIANATNARLPVSVHKYTSVTDAYQANWNLGHPKYMTTFIRASKSDHKWKRFDVGVTNVPTLMDLILDKSTLFRWDCLMNVVIKGTSKIAAVPKNLADGTKIFDAGFVKLVNLALRCTTVSLKH